MNQRRTYLALAGALALVLAVMAGVTLTLLRLDAERSASEREAVVEEQVRLALWRIDSAMTPVLSREVALLDAGLRAPPAELPAPAAGVVTRFVLDDGGLRPLTVANTERLASLGDELRTAELLAERERGLRLIDTDDKADKDGASGRSGGLAVGEGAGDRGGYGEAAADAEPYALQTQTRRNEGEWAQRRASVEDNVVNYANLSRAGQVQGVDGGAELAPPDIVELEAVWLAGELLLIRTLGATTADSGPRVEGIWLDWPVLREELLAEVAELLPAATLEPVEDIDSVGTERLLATLPARLVPGETVAAPPSWSPLRAALVVGWLLVLAAFVAVALLVREALTLSERRATFVSAVTHELRTPLTTFRMYTEMLGEGMVEARKRERYVAVLRREAERLSGLVENVLAYAQVEAEGGQASDKRVPTELGALLDQVEARLCGRCEAADMTLELDVEPSLRGRELLIDPAAVEQILFNLVENAAKYGRGAEDPRIRVHAVDRGRKLELHVRDFGPGIAPGEARRVFEPFTKAEADAAGTKPGVGLGLALSRRLARQLGGELELDASVSPGADFCLSLRCWS